MNDVGLVAPEAYRDGVPRAVERPRHVVSPRWVVLLRVVGFRYSVSRDAYILRLVGNRFGPVFMQRRPQRAPRIHSRT